MIRDPSDGSVKTENTELITPTGTTPSAKVKDMRVTGLAALQAKYGPNWGLKIDKRERKPKPAPTAEELRAHYATHNLGFKPKESE